MKHAYLIMAANEFEEILVLLKALDYEDNAIFLHIDKKAEIIFSSPTVYIFYLRHEWDNHNEGLDREMTKDMHLIYEFHNLFSHMEFSIFDLLWVRDFNIEIKVECGRTRHARMRIFVVLVCALRWSV